MPLSPPAAVGARLLAVLLVAAALTLGTAVPAAAHTELESSAPAAGSTVTEAPAAVTLTFAGTVRGADVTVTGPDGVATTGPATVDGAEVRVPVDLSTAGGYDVVWYATGEDGHPLQGSFGFTYAPPGGPAPTAAPTSTAPSPAAGTSPGTPVGTRNDVIERADEGEETGTPGWVLPVLAAAAVAVGAVLALLLRRRRG